MATEIQSERKTIERPARGVATASDRRLVPRKVNSRRSWWVRGTVVICVVALVAVAASFMIGAATPEKSGPRLLHTIARRNLDVTVTEEGTLESSNNTEVRCKVRGGNSTIVWIIENGTEVQPGDELVRLDKSTIEDNINTQKIAYQAALATHAQSESDVAVAEINITEYLEGTYVSELKTKEKDVAIAKTNLVSAENVLDYSRRVFQKGYISKLEVEGNEFSLQQAQLELEVKETELEVLKRYTKAKQLKDLEGILKAKQAKLASDKAALDLEKAKLDREQQQLENCIIRAEVNGMAIYGGSQKWEDRPDIREGATVREDQILLLIPDLSQMQVKVGIHESKIDRVKPGLRAKIDLQDRTLDGEVLTVASMAAPAGWWNGNMVKYETTIKVDKQSGLKPGMSADVEVFLAQHADVITIPVAAVVEQEGRFFCWVKTDRGTQRRELKLGDSDDQFLVVETGVKEGDQVVLNPLAYIQQVQDEALRPFSGVKTNQAQESAPDAKKPTQPDKPAASGPPSAKKPAAQPAAKEARFQITGAQILKFADKNGDGVLTKDEFSEKDRKDFDKTDLNHNGEVDEAELDAVIKSKMGETK